MAFGKSRCIIPFQIFNLIPSPVSEERENRQQANVWENDERQAHVWADVDYT